MSDERKPLNWSLPGMSKDKQSVTPDWQSFDQKLIDGVTVKEIKNVLTGQGYLTEIYRSEWKLEPSMVAQVFQTLLEPGAVSAWHAHAKTTDRLFVSTGRILIVLFDARQDSPTHRRINQFRFGSVRPALVTIPAGVWHGIQNVANQPSVLLNLVSDCYSYEDPDHYRLPPTSGEIPFHFQAGTRVALEQAKTTSG